MFDHPGGRWEEATGLATTLSLRDHDSADDLITQASRAAAEIAAAEFGQELPSEAELTDLLDGPPAGGQRD